MTAGPEASARSRFPHAKPADQAARPPAPQAWCRGPEHRPPDTLLWGQITARAARSPTAPAVRQWDARLSYGELIGAAASLAERLRRLGAGPESRVGICVRRSLLLPVSVLGVIASGAAYVALDPAHPPRRLRSILRDAGVGIVIADETGRSLLAGAGPRLLTPSLTEHADPAPCPAHPGNAAYVLYTSGSTGEPKGVAVSHRSVASFVTASGGHFGLDDTCRSIAFSALGFDVSVLDMLTPLAWGGCAQLVPDRDRADSARLQRFLEAHGVTWGFIPPALLPLLDPDKLPALRHVVTAGEPPGPEQVARWSAPPKRRLHNWYGPTEATVCVVGCELTGDWHRPVPIGRPLAGCRAYILDARMDPCPAGVPGELYLGGEQLARGYWGCPGLTAERFVPDRFGDEPGGRLYRTGDRVVREPDGRISYLGRLDRQVKVQGQRVEIGEVESVVREHPRVLQAVIDADPERGGELVAYLAPADAPDPAELREHCATRLPGYMTPSRVFRFDTLPLDTSGKTDLRALRAAAANGVRAAPVNGARTAPATAPGPGPFVGVVAQTWAEILETGHPRPDDDFFGCGGHSLRAMRLVSALRARTGRDLAVEDVYDGRTVAGLAARTAAARLLDDTVLNSGNPPALSNAQRRMWFVEQVAPGVPAHNIAYAERLTGPLDPAALRAAFSAVASRHQPLRWRVGQRDGVPYAEVAEVVRAPLAVVDLSSRPATEREASLREWLDAEAVAPFELAAGPLWRATLIRLAPEDHVLAFTAHHLVFDGWSADVLYGDLAASYAAGVRGEPAGLAPLPAEFADYVAALDEHGARSGAADLGWWAQRLSGAATVCDLPRDRPRPSVQTFRGAARAAELDPEATEGVRALARRLGVTPHTVLLAAFGVLLRRLTGEHDMVVGVPYADRDNVAFEPMIGLLLQILPLRLRVADEEAFVAHVRRCAEQVRLAVAHRRAPLERVVEALRLPRDLTRNPLIQVLFNMHDFAEPRLDLPGCQATPIRAGLPGSLFDLTLYVSGGSVSGGSVSGRAGLSLQAVYNPDLYDAERIDGYLDSYRCLVRDLTAMPDAAVRRASGRRSGGAGDGPPPEWSDPLPARTAAGVVERVARAAAEHPDAVAVAGSGGEVGYREFDESWRRVCAAVHAAGVGAGDTVAVLAARDAALPGLLLGVLAAGAQWAILDAGLPAARLAGQAAAARATALLVCPGATIPGVRIPEVLSRLPVIPDPSGGARDDVAAAAVRRYLAFTSGTTGEPQVVLTPEAPLAGFLCWYAETFGLGPDDRFAMLAGLSHDPLLRDVFTPLTLGARLAVPEEEWLRDPARLGKWLREQRTTVAHLTPQLGRMLASDRTVAPLPQLRLVAVAGDQLTAADAERLRTLAPRARLVNFYGATETPQAHGWYDVPPRPEGEIVPVGHGVPGSRLVVVDGLGRPAAMGELGEVVIRSGGLATGYLDPDATRRRFLPTPGSADPRDRRYRTGDLGRHRPDGAVVLAGRVDDQVKVRGYRVELGEVEAALAAHPGVRAAAAVGTGGSIRGFVAPAQPDLRVADLLDHLRARLPGYAVPAELRLVPAIPLTPNGKLDRRALLSRDPRPRAAPTDDTLRTPHERLAAEVWRSVLGRPRVGAEDNFFDVGGHSLALVAVAARLSAAVGREIPVVELFRYPTVRALARYLDGDRLRPGLERAARRVAVRRERSRRRSTDHGRGAVEETGGSHR